MSADSIPDAAQKCLALMPHPRVLGRSVHQQHRKMTDVVKDCERLGYVEYIGTGGSGLRITEKGRDKLQLLRETTRGVPKVLS